MPADLQSFLASHRRAAGLSLTALAARVGVSRQALTAIEAGRATPSTALALRLARQLGCRVEDLFAIAADAVPDLSVPALVGTRVTLGRVRGRWVAHPIDPRSTDPADGIVGASGSVQPLEDLDDLSNTVLVAGCAPVLGVLSGHLGRQGRGGGARWIHNSSASALRALAQGRVHLAGMHLAELDRPEEHDRLVRQRLPGVPVEIVRLVGWREGLALAPGNPLGLRGVEDLARPGTRVGRRAQGSGAARVLAAALARHGLAQDQIEGPAVASHIDAAFAVLHGAVDAAVIIEPMALAFGLPFLPLAEERFELAVRVDDLSHPGMQRLMARLCSTRFADEVLQMGAYDVTDMGQTRRLVAA
ncbi:MAG: helix-turn-helix domain-containing protein [Oligoflexia bacterium]|nr:helix-turn-helix domain-containing protein [Oligoflexia bacterium]